MYQGAKVRSLQKESAWRNKKIVTHDDLMKKYWGKYPNDWDESKRVQLISTYFLEKSAIAKRLVSIDRETKKKKFIKEFYCGCCVFPTAMIGYFKISYCKTDITSGEHNKDTKCNLCNNTLEDVIVQILEFKKNPNWKNILIEQGRSVIFRKYPWSIKKWPISNQFTKLRIKELLPIGYQLNKKYLGVSNDVWIDKILPFLIDTHWNNN